jgi:hypothetical protein
LPPENAVKGKGAPMDTNVPEVVDVAGKDNVILLLPIEALVLFGAIPVPVIVHPTLSPITLATPEIVVVPEIVDPINVVVGFNATENCVDVIVDPIT